MIHPTITISFRPTKAKLFRSKKKSLLVVDCTCINGSVNRIGPGNKALLHIRSSSSTLPAGIDGIEHLANDIMLLADDDEGEEARAHLNKGCWVDVDDTIQRSS